MARHATSPSKKQVKLQTTAAAKASEPTAAETPRRGRKAKPVMPEQAEPSLTDMFFPGSEAPTETGAEVEPSPPVKVRWGRQPKAQPEEQAPASIAADDGVPAESASPELDLNSDGAPSSAQTDSSAPPSASPRKARRPRDVPPEAPPAASEASPDTAVATQPMQQAAARWDADTGAATFDWPGIEQVAAADGPNQAMAKLLLAARAEGANSRWPF